MTQSIELPGLDGSNPLAFMAALGVLRCLHISHPQWDARLAWQRNLCPALQLAQPASQDALAESLRQTVKKIADDGVASMGDIIGVEVDDFRKFADPGRNVPVLNLLFASAYGSDAVVEPKNGTIVPTQISFANGQGHKKLLKDFRTLAKALTVERVNAALFAPWKYEDENMPTFRWDPGDMRMGAYMAAAPKDTAASSVTAANALAFAGMSFFTCAPSDGKLHTAGFQRIDAALCFTWPLWQHPLSPDVIQSLLQQATPAEDTGVFVRFACEKITYQKNLYFGPSKAL